MSTKAILILVDDDSWPNLYCSVYAGLDPALLNDVANRSDWPVRVHRESLYDTAQSNFEMPVLNALRPAISDLIRQRKQGVSNEQVRPWQSPEGYARVLAGEAPQRQQKGKESHQPKASNRNRVKRTAKSKPKKKVTNSGSVNQNPKRR